MDSDRILVMDDGKVAELDSPAALLEVCGCVARLHYGTHLLSTTRQQFQHLSL